MNYDFESNGCLTAIKRRQTYFEPFIKEYRKKTVKLNQNILIESLNKLVEQINIFTPNRILLLNSRPEFDKIFTLFCKYMGCTVHFGKIIPGTFTNPTSKYFIQPKAIFIGHDKKEKQAVTEAKKIKIKVIGFNNIARGVKDYDICAIINNFNINSIGYAFWYIIKQYYSLHNREFKPFEEFSAEYA